MAHVLYNTVFWYVTDNIVMFLQSVGRVELLPGSRVYISLDAHTAFQLACESEDGWVAGLRILMRSVFSRETLQHSVVTGKRSKKYLPLPPKEWAVIKGKTNFKYIICLFVVQLLSFSIF